ncbi:uncharacterized protein LOC124659240 [Lolium rigidum]|uniref:uncharacterized protein LOC124659240 n=1 Tax=Lolium rigidum TaxID=89674 RepID=UPI001F5E31EC|nr:uncharacterized protein LOC124659240 [Lolium rigidum]
MLGSTAAVPPYQHQGCPSGFLHRLPHALKGLFLHCFPRHMQPAFRRRQLPRGEKERPPKAPPKKRFMPPCVLQVLEQGYKVKGQQLAHGKSNYVMSEKSSPVQLQSRNGLLPTALDAVPTTNSEAFCFLVLLQNFF